MPENVSISSSPLAEDFSRAQLVVVYNSAAGVESVLEGIPTVTFDEGAMAWPVAAHNLDDPPIAPDRTKWCHDLAWTQWFLGKLGTERPGK